MEKYCVKSKNLVLSEWNNENSGKILELNNRNVTKFQIFPPKIRETTFFILESK